MTETIATVTGIPARTEPQGTIWVCVDCMLVHANGEESDDRDSSQPDTWALWADWPAGELTMGMLASDHDCGRADNSPCEDDCECEHRTFSWSACEGCGSNLGGERHAFTYWA